MMFPQLAFQIDVNSPEQKVSVRDKLIMHLRPKALNCGAFVHVTPHHTQKVCTRFACQESLCFVSNQSISTTEVQLFPDN